MGTGTAVTIITLSLVGVFLAYSAISSYLYGRKLRGATVTRGLSGQSGQTVNLQCQPGQTISFTNNNPTTSRAVLLAPVFSGATCDPFFTPSTGQSQTFFNQSTTVDLLASGAPYNLSACEGRETCTFTVPAPTDSALSGLASGCLSQAGSVSLIGTYDCVWG